MVRKLVLLCLAVLAAGPAAAQSAGWDHTVRGLIVSAQSYPRAAQARGEEGVAKVKLVISGGGKLVTAELVQSTGSATLDKEAIRIVQKVGSFPAPPGGSDTTVIVPLSWKLS
jgi:protein TonB